MYEVILVAIAILLMYSQREHYSLKPGGYDFFSSNPDTCAPDEEDSDGLCYKKCQEGFHGVVTRCYKDLEPVGDNPNDGIGQAVHQIGCSMFPGGWHEATPGFCKRGDPWKPLWESGHEEVRSNLGCDGARPDMVGALCFPKCKNPKLQHLVRDPRFCYSGEPESYDRGAGTVPPAFLIGTYGYYVLIVVLIIFVFSLVGL